MGKPFLVVCLVMFPSSGLSMEILMLFLLAILRVVCVILFLYSLFFFSF